MSTPHSSVSTSTESSSQLGDVDDTRSRILRAAFRLFRKHGYNGVGLADLLAEASAPKGSLYHHFPQGKEAVGVAVIRHIAADVARAFATPPGGRKRTGHLVKQGGEHLAMLMQRTNHEICALFSAFVTERHRSPLLGAAIANAYAGMVEQLTRELVLDGWPKRAARARALLIVATLEGGALVSQAQGDASAFRVALKHAIELCDLANP